MIHLTATSWQRLHVKVCAQQIVAAWFVVIAGSSLHCTLLLLLHLKSSKSRPGPLFQLPELKDFEARVAMCMLLSMYTCVCECPCPDGEGVISACLPQSQKGTKRCESYSDSLLHYTGLAWPCPPLWIIDLVQWRTLAAWKLQDGKLLFPANCIST